MSDNVIISYIRGDRALARRWDRLTVNGKQWVLCNAAGDFTRVAGLIELAIKRRK